MKGVEVACNMHPSTVLNEGKCGDCEANGNRLAWDRFFAWEEFARHAMHNVAWVASSRDKSAMSAAAQADAMIVEWEKRRPKQ